jgi:hypothetical protein
MTLHDLIQYANNSELWARDELELLWPELAAVAEAARSLVGPGANPNAAEAFQAIEETLAALDARLEENQ